MERFLEGFQKYKESVSFFRSLAEEEKKEDKLDNYLTFLNMALFRKLISSKFIKTKLLRKCIAKKLQEEEGSNDIKASLYKLALSKPVFFKDINIKAMFYRELKEYSHLFLNDNTDPHFVLADLFLLGKYYNEDVSKRMSGIVKEMCIAERLLFSVLLQPLLRSEDVIDILGQVPLSVCTNNEISCFFYALRTVPSAKKYLFVSELLFEASDYDRESYLLAIRDTDGYCSENILKSMLDICFKDPKVNKKMYITSLRACSLLNFSYFLRLEVLYAWLRYFLITRQIDCFVDLFESMGDTGRRHPEYHFHHRFYSLFTRKPVQQSTLDLLEVYTNSFASYSLDDIVKCYQENKLKGL